MTRAYAFLGAGEFEPWSEVVDRWVLERADGDGRVLILPTASAPEGDEVFDEWAGKGLAHYGLLGIPAEVLPMKTREDAERAELVERVREASVVYFSGGNPYHLASVLRGSAFCRAMVDRLEDGLGFVGCSAGVACLTEVTYDTAGDLLSREVWKPGLSYVRRLLFAPHWDTVEQWFPGAQAFIVASLEPGQTLVAIDEDTAMVGDGGRWDVLGRAAVHVHRDGAWVDHHAGEGFELALELARPV
ncbi:MAG: Type 1 glutamine amidotransferase-like domain-containing protein [Solirubrobacterales bacterium]